MIEILNVNLNFDTTAIKFVGVFFDPLLNFKFHINYVTIKLPRALYFLRTAKNNLTFAARKLLYYSLFHSNVIYGIHVWSCATPWSYSCIPFKNARVLPLSCLIEFFILQFVQQFTQGYFAYIL
jgi:hypothetical protein